MSIRQQGNAPAAIRGMGCVVADAIDCAAFEAVLRAPDTRPTRIDLLRDEVAHVFDLPDLGDLVARIETLLPGRDTAIATAKRLARGGVTMRATLLAAAEAWAQAGLTDGSKVGLILAGNNLDPQSAHEQSLKYESSGFNPVRRGFQWLDGHLLGAVSQMLGLRGPGFQVGGSSAAGLLGAYQALTLQRAGLADTWLVVAPPMVLSPVEYATMKGLGAMLEDGGEGTGVLSLCAPFDEGVRGFVPGIGAAAMIIDTSEADLYLRGGATEMHADALTEPHAGAEASVMRAALQNAGLEPGDIGYVNAHGTASPLGDLTEAEALRDVFGDGPWINATKSITGHCLTSAGLIELVATALQMRGGFVHANRALNAPIAPDLRFVPQSVQPAAITHAMCNSYAFGGVNAAMVVSAERGGRS